MEHRSEIVALVSYAASFWIRKRKICPQPASVVAVVVVVEAEESFQVRLDPLVEVRFCAANGLKVRRRSENVERFCDYCDAVSFGSSSDWSAPCSRTSFEATQAGRRQRPKRS